MIVSLREAQRASSKPWNAFTGADYMRWKLPDAVPSSSIRTHFGKWAIAKAVASGLHDALSGAHRGEAQQRSCLKCNEPFMSASRANRICLRCSVRNIRVLSLEERPDLPR